MSKNFDPWCFCPKCSKGRIDYTNVDIQRRKRNWKEGR